MRTAASWLREYADSHRNPTNERLHRICVPAIVLSVLGLLWSVPYPGELAALAPQLNWAVVVAAAAMVYYFVLSPLLAVGVLVAVVAMFAAIQWLETLGPPLWATSLAIFVVAWIGQFIGHAIEGKRPSFFKDVQFLLIGPLWLVDSAYRALGLRY